LTVDGNKFATHALSLGATAILTAKKSEIFQAQLIVNDVNLALGVLSSAIFKSQVQQKLSVGVTGTNGKTSISFLVAQAISLLDGMAVYGGTLGLKVMSAGKELEEGVDTNTTSPESVEFHRYLARYPNSRGFAVEVSSMALDQKRLCGLELDVAVFSNLTRDHLDYHKTLDNYFEAKKSLFLRDLRQSSKTEKIAVLNIQPENLRKFAEELKDLKFNLRGYSTDFNINADYPITRLVKHKLLLSGTSFDFEIDGETYHAESRLIGHYNLENLLAVITVLVALHYPIQKVLEVLPKLSGVPGRVQPVEIGHKNAPTVLVDYAHTPDALENALSSVRQLVKGRLITVFGCGGDRDKGKRPLMAEVASRLSDLTILTSDNPRTEAPESIIEDARKGLIPGSSCLSIVDRKEAIFEAILEATASDTVIIAGKGHEPYQEINGVRYRFLDEEVTRLALQRKFNSVSIG